MLVTKLYCWLIGSQQQFGKNGHQHSKPVASSRDQFNRHFQVMFIVVDHRVWLIMPKAKGFAFLIGLINLFVSSDKNHLRLFFNLSKFIFGTWQVNPNNLQWPADKKHKRNEPSLTLYSFNSGSKSESAPEIFEVCGKVSRALAMKSRPNPTTLAPWDVDEIAFSILGHA